MENGAKRYVWFGVKHWNSYIGSVFRKIVNNASYEAIVTDLKTFFAPISFHYFTSMDLIKLAQTGQVLPMWTTWRFPASVWKGVEKKAKRTSSCPTWVLKRWTCSWVQFQESTEKNSGGNHKAVSWHTHTIIVKIFAKPGLSKCQWGCGVTATLTQIADRRETDATVWETCLPALRKPTLCISYNPALHFLVYIQQKCIHMATQGPVKGSLEQLSL